MLSDQAFLRYSRQLMLPEISELGQYQLSQKKVLIVGLGGLGSAAALYLASSGIGELWLADDDCVELSNLSRQILYRGSDIGHEKVERAKQHLLALNADLFIVALKQKMQGQALSHAIAQVDLVLDCSDNFTTRYEVNRYCVEHQIPLISGAAIGWNGQILCVDPRNALSPCYHCIYPNHAYRSTDNCQSMGVASPLVGVIGSMQALEGLKWLTSASLSSIGQLMQFDGLKGTWQRVSGVRDPKCSVCKETRRCKDADSIE